MTKKRLKNVIFVTEENPRVKGVITPLETGVTRKKLFS